uniref:CBS domain-containing protein n=1 Tax=Oryza meridionalis TaxID=40149 RepID=A0A0E0CFX1_9ORYZ
MAQQLRAPAAEEALLRGHAGDKDDAVAGESKDAKRARAGLRGVLRERKVVELARAKRRLVEVPYTATLAHTANALLAARVSAVAVAAPPGHWIGAGGSMILESDPATGAVRKHYIGMVNMLDILAHIAEAGDDNDADADAAPGEAVDLDRRMAVPVSSVIGHSLEGLTLWTLHPNTSVLDCMETFSKGVHRALVPLESAAENVVAAELVEAAPGYRMVTQMDVARFLRARGAELGDAILSRSVRDVGVGAVLAVASGAKVIEAVRAMRAASLAAVPVVDATPADDADARVLHLQDGRGRRVVETFSATDLRDCPVAELQAWLGVAVAEFKKKVAVYRAGVLAADEEEEERRRRREMVTCSPESTLGEAIEKAVAHHVHRLWVVDEGLLAGVVSLTDVLRVVREAAIGEDRELHDTLS